MSLEKTIKDTLIAESVDLDARLQALVRAGLMPANTIPILRKAIAKTQGGMALQGAERDVMANFLNSMMFIVLGDDTIFNKARATAKSVPHHPYVQYATEAKEKQEYDYEGDMAMSQLKSIIANSQKMHDMLSADTNIPEWVQSKITLAEDYISTAANYMQGEMNEEVEELDELSSEKLAWYKKHSEKQADKSMKTMAKHLDKAAVARGRGNSPKGKMHDALASAAYNHSLKRTAGMAMARKKLANEEVESIDELSRATVGSYARKAKAEADNLGGFDDHRAKGRELAGRKRWGGTMKGVKKAKVMATESRRGEALADIAAITRMNESYKSTFNAALTQYGIKSPSELDEEKRKEFFNFVDQNYKQGDN